MKSQQSLLEEAMVLSKKSVIQGGDFEGVFSCSGTFYLLKHRQWLIHWLGLPVGLPVGDTRKQTRYDLGWGTHHLPMVMMAIWPFLPLQSLLAMLFDDWWCIWQNQSVDVVLSSVSSSHQCLSTAKNLPQTWAQYHTNIWHSLSTFGKVFYP